MFVDLVSVGVTHQRRQPAARRLGVEAGGSSGFVQHLSRALVVAVGLITTSCDVDHMLLISQ